MYKKIIWLSILAIALISSAVFITGFAASLAITTGIASNKSKTPTAQNAPQNNKAPELDANSYNILVIGDSLANGAGDEKGQGFAKDFADLWKSKTTKPIKVNNIAVNGDISSGLLQIVQSPQTAPYIQSSSIIFISIGGNEIKSFGGDKYTSTSPEVKTAEDNYISNFKKILKLLRTLNNKCTIVDIGLYNPFGDKLNPEKIKLLNNWNYDTQQLLSEDTNSVFIPTYDLFQYNLNSYLTIDHFHPNSLGYAAISQRIVEAMKNY